MVRIFPETLESLPVDIKLMITNELNTFTFRNLEKYNELNNPSNLDARCVNKNKTKNES